MMKHIAGAVMLASLWASPAAAQFAAPPKLFETTCEGCHGEGGAGGDRAPALMNNITLRAMNEAQIRDLVKSGTPGGMPGIAHMMYGANGMVDQAATFASNRV